MGRRGLEPLQQVVGLEMLRDQLQDLLAEQPGVVEPLLLERLVRFVEVLLREPFDLFPPAARLLDAPIGLGVRDIDQVDPRPGIDRGLEVAAVELVLALVEQDLDPGRGALRARGSRHAGGKRPGRVRVEFDRVARDRFVEGERPRDRGQDRRRRRRGPW